MLAAHGRAAIASGPSAPATRLPGFHAQTWTTEQGLPGDTVRAVQQTRDGYLWIATQGGLARFDGVRFHVFNKQVVKEFRTNECSELLEDRAGQLWIGTIGGGLMRYAAGKFTVYGRAEGLLTDVVIRLFEDRAGRLWITSYENLTLFDGNKFTTFNTADGGRNVYAFPFYEDEEGRVWFFNTRGLSFTNNAALSFYRDGRLHTGDEAARLFPRRFTSNSGGFPVREAFWMQSEQTRTLTRLPFAKGSAAPVEVKYDADITPVRAYEDAQGRLWITTQLRELFLLSDGLLRRVTTSSPPRGEINALHADREGNLWMGTSNGLTRLKAQAFAAYTAADGLAHESPWTIYEDSRGDLWVGTSDGLNRRREDGTFDTYTVRDGMAGNAVVSISEDASGRLWFGSTEGLTSYKDGRFQAYARREGLLNENVRGVLVDRRGRLWVGTVGGLHLFEGGRFKPYTTAEGLAHNNVLFMHEDSHGSLWIGTPNGLNRLRDERFETFTLKDGLASNIAIEAHETNDGALWFGMVGGGLARFKAGKFKSITSAAGLGDDTITRVLEDGAGNFWMGSTRGVLRASLKDLNDYADEHARAITCVAYGKADGLPSIDCSGGTQPAGWRTRAGTLWFPTAQGIAVLDPARLTLNELPPPVVVENLVVDRATVEITDNLRLPRGSRAVEIHFTALSFVDPSKVRFRYMLEGFDRDWVEAGARRDAFYTNLPPGSYRFRVLAANDDGVWSDGGGAMLAFALPPYFYQTRWFYLVAALFTAAAMWGVYQLRVRQLKREFVAVLEERNRIARELHDSLAQGFTSISIHLEAVSAKMGAPHDAAREHLNQARLLVRSSLAEARRTVRDLRSGLLETGDLAAALSRVADELTAGTSVAAQVTVTGATRPLPARIENNLLRVGQEALTNAVRHSGARTVRVRLEYGGRQLKLHIEDDGEGFDVQTIATVSNGGFGLRGMRERLIQIGGALTVESLPGRGTEITAIVPFGENGDAA